MTFWRQTLVALALASVPAATAEAQSGVSVGGFETDGSVGLDRADYTALGRALSALLSGQLGDRTTATVVPINTAPGSRPGRVDVGAARTAAQAAGAKLLVVGSLLDQYGDIQVEARVIDAVTGEPIAVVRGDPALARRESLADAIVSLADQLGEQQGLGSRGGEAASRALPITALIHFGRGLGLEDSGDRSGAAAEYRQAVAAAPGFNEAQVALRRVGG